MGDKWFKTFIFQLFVFSLFIRSNIYFFDTAISLMNIVNIFIIFYIIINYQKKYHLNFIILMSLLLFFIVIEFFYLILNYRNIDQIKEFYYTSYFISLGFFFYISFKDLKKDFFTIMFNTLYKIYWVLFIVVLIEIFFTVHLPGTRGYIDMGFKYQPSGFFFNPNDFAVVIACFYPLIYYLYYQNQKKIKLIIFSLFTLFFLIITMSRGALIIFLLFPICLSIIKLNFKKIISWFIILNITIFIFINIGKIINIKESKILGNNFTKFTSIFNNSNTNTKIAKDNTLSNNVRFDVYKSVISNADHYFIGYGILGSNYLFNSKEIKIRNPHSYWIEGIINFGIIGFSPMLLVFIFSMYLFLSKFGNILYRFCFFQFLYFILLVNIPSSIMSLPVIWIPVIFFIVVAYQKSNNLILYEKAN